MKVLAHPDPVALERELLARVDAAHPASGEGRTLILVPTRRLAEHVQRRLLDLRPAWLGLQVFHFRALTRDVLARESDHNLRLVSSRLLEALVRKLLDEKPDGLWSRFVEKRPGALSAVTRALEDLREGVVSPEDLAAECGGHDRDRALAGLYERYVGELQALAANRTVDEAGLIRAALAHVETYCRDVHAVFLHGAYELIGIHLDLVRALDRTRGLTVMLPASPGARVTSYAETFARRHLLGPGESIEVLDDRRGGDRLRLLTALYDEESRPAPGGGWDLRFHHTQGAAAEAKIAVREALGAVRDGCRPREIAIAARGLGPYVSAFEEATDEERLAWTTSAQTPLRRHPAIHDLMLLLEVVDREFPRRATAEILRSPRVRWRALLPGEPAPHGDRADRWSRQAGVIGSLADWTELLPAWAARLRPSEDRTDEERAAAEQRAAERVEECRRIGRALGALNERLEPGRPRTWSDHARILQDVAGELLHEPEDRDATAAMETARGLIDEMRDLELVVGETGPVSLAKMRAWLDKAVDGAELALRAEDNGGIRVLDAMQLRGLTFDRVFLVGMNSGQFPRPPREDPILSDALRRRLGRRTGRPIAIKSRGTEEERLLLALVLGAAKERIDVCWQRADESGRARTPSLALRELARLALGRPDMTRLIEGARHLPSHPTHWLERLAAGPGLLSATDERLLAALRSRGPAPGLESWFGELGPGLRMLRATEAFTRVDPSYDGRVGPPPGAPETYSVTPLEALGSCPLRYFFRHVLRARELDEEASAFEISKRELGSRIHDLLETVYRRLWEERRFEPSSQQDLFSELRGSELIERGREVLERSWPEAMDEPGGRLSRRVPVLWNLLRDRWLTALAAFLEEDLARIAERGLRPAALEQPVTGEIDLGRGMRTRIRGRFDRRLEGAGGSVVGDYKTSGNLAARGDITSMLKARALQVPLYWLLAGPGSTVELLGAGPSYDYAEESAESSRRVVFGGFENDAQRAGFLETVRTLIALVEHGRFPLRPDMHCDWCPYTLACRNTHPPTLNREASSPDTIDYRLLADKNKTRRPGLAQLRRAEEA